MNFDKTSLAWGPSVLSAVYLAADAILEVYEGRREMNVELKSDQSPVTDADHAANAVLEPVLLAAGYPVLSEEGRKIPFEERTKWNTYWVVDPLDGTKEFIKRNGDSP